jgi:hypothetical protein
MLLDASPAKGFRNRCAAELRQKFPLPAAAAVGTGWYEGRHGCR